MATDPGENRQGGHPAVFTNKEKASCCAKRENDQDRTLGKSLLQATTMASLPNKVLLATRRSPAESIVAKFETAFMLLVDKQSRVIQPMKEKYSTRG